VLTGYLSFGRRPGIDWANMTLDKKFNDLLFKQEVAIAAVTSIFSSLSLSMSKPN